MLAGIRRNGFFDNLVLVSTTLIVSIPILVLAFVAQYVFGLKLGWFPIAGINEGWYSYLLPGLVLASGSLAYVARLTRTSIAENMRADYVRTARAKGLPQPDGHRAAHAAQQPDPGGHLHRRRHRRRCWAARSSPRPCSTSRASAARSSTRSAARRARSSSASSRCMVFFFVFFNLIVDVLYAVLDPRIRYD